MPHVIVTGGPGAGKTTLLAELGALGYATVEESARSIIVERLARGASRRPDALAFAQEILRRDIEKYRNQPRTAQWVFFERGLIDALGMLHEASPLPSIELESVLAAYPFHTTVFVLPPWEVIYVNDAERDQSFAEAVDVHAKVVEWYRACGYSLNEVPRLPVARRAAHVLRNLADRVGVSGNSETEQEARQRALKTVPLQPTSIAGTSSRVETAVEPRSRLSGKA
jgi:predicted ATPase